jgi:hypothetical protein
MGGRTPAGRQQLSADPHLRRHRGAECAAGLLQAPVGTPFFVGDLPTRSPVFNDDGFLAQPDEQQYALGTKLFTGPRVPGWAGASVCRNACPCCSRSSPTHARPRASELPRGLRGPSRGAV